MGLSNAMTAIAKGFKYGEFALIEIDYYEKNSCLRDILLSYRSISHVNSSQKPSHGLLANAQGAA
jgi:hypothetical protein